MKLRVVELLVVTTIPALFLASRGIPPLVVSAATLIGGTLAAGAANAFNMIIESDIDQLMGRTSKRPIVNKEITERQALIFAFSITIVSLSIFWFFTTKLATALTAGAIIFYVFIYTIGLKRRTNQNIVWGGIAGCFPVIIGWSAITNSLSWTAALFFLLVFFWTPPHFWALAIKYRDDYSAAGIPMLPSVAPIGEVAKQMRFHTIAMFATSFLTLWSANAPILSYLVALGLAIFFAYLMRGLTGASSEKVAMRVFHGSITYLSIYSILLVVVAFA